MSATAPGGGGSLMRWTIATGRPASPRSSESRGAWSEAMTTRARSPAQCSTASTSRSVRPGGRTGSRQPKASPELSPPAAKLMPSAACGSDSQVSSSVRPAASRWVHAFRARYAVGQVLGRSPLSTSSARRSSA